MKKRIHIPITAHSLGYRHRNRLRSRRLQKADLLAGGSSIEHSGYILIAYI